MQLATPGRLTPLERAAEISAILAAALSRQDYALPKEQLPLAISPGKSVHATPSDKQGVAA